MRCSKRGERCHGEEGFFFFNLRKCRVKNIHDLQNCTLSSSSLYCILSLLDSGALSRFGLPELIVSALLHRYFFTGNSWKPERGSQKGAWPVLYSFYWGGESRGCGNERQSECNLVVEAWERQKQIYRWCMATKKRNMVKERKKNK